ncbi:hypothetical protein [Gracilibacillus xinjiangensis]|uniref:PH domain-containing protein n=1 Tax=Gracilibacillus xinjiangensis TaxID=1193282 RepID=A0ABV8WWK8_9BACI
MSGTKGITGNKVFFLDGHQSGHVFLYEIRTAKEARKWLKVVEEIS